MIRVICGCNCLSVKYDSDSDSEIVLRAVKQPRRVVVDLDRPDRNAIACLNVDTAAERTGKSGLGFSVIVTRTRDYRSAGDVIEIQAGTTLRDADEGMNEWLKRSFVRVVFDLHASKKVIETCFNIHVRARKTGNREIPALEVSRKIALDPEISC